MYKRSLLTLSYCIFCLIYSIYILSIADCFVHVRDLSISNFLLGIVKGGENMSDISSKSSSGGRTSVIITSSNSKYLINID